MPKKFSYGLLVKPLAVILGVLVIVGMPFVPKHKPSSKAILLTTLKPKPAYPNNIQALNSTWEHLGCLDILDPKALEAGSQEMRQHKVVIAGITRDNANELPTVIKYIERTGQTFQDYRVVLFENDSTDGTKEILKKWGTKNK